MQSNTYKIGTRGSLLALTQCNLIKKEIEEESGLNFELKVLKTQGDQITDKPLWQLEGKDFFTKELDQALLKADIDLVVHSYKDLGSERPKGILLNTITERKYAHDILLIKKKTVEEIGSKEKLVIGTSSPRRIYNITNGLAENLPCKNISIECKTLRGNVNTRIEKLLDDQYDGIVLALAGLERLASKEDSLKILTELTSDLNFMILPQKDFPSSASQGALAIECHDNASDILKEGLKKVHHDQTQAEISRERKAFNSYGGGCHLAVGVHVKKINNIFVHIHKGHVDDLAIKKLEIEGVDYSNLKNKKIYNVLAERDFLIKKSPIENKTKKDNLFVTSKHCLKNIGQFNSLWSAGSTTRKALLKAGHWVNGCADGFGHKEIEILKESNAIKLLLKNNAWKVLSHKDADSSIGEVIACYEHQINQNFDSSMESELMSSDAIYWNSFTQYQIYSDTYPQIKEKINICGLGKTLDQFESHNINAIPSLSYKDLLTRLEYE